MQREAPAYIVAGLHQVDPRADVLWWGPMTDVVEETDPARPWARRVVRRTRPMWVVGTQSGSVLDHMAGLRIAQLEAMKIPAKVDQQPAVLTAWRKSWRDRRRMAQLKYDGFVAKFFWPARDLDWAVVTEFEAMGWFSRHLFELTRRMALHELREEGPELGLNERQRLIAEAVRLETPSIWRYAMRGRRSVMVPATAA